MPESDLNNDYVAIVEKLWTDLWVNTKSSERTLDDFQTYFDMMADDVVFKIEGPEGWGLPTYPAEHRGKARVLEVYTKEDPGLVDQIDYERPPEFIGQSNRVVILGAERYRIKKTDVMARNKEFAIVIDFRGGKIVRVHQVADLSEFAFAYRPEDGTAQA
ncbi:nuclear transport factor 2 family protein [Jiangella asiatica]|uniref:SnoaL-like domain-containing protein n=1 Tax=Jiangella asiatica TaxID=2530372 RepID=A0A4R5C6S0_9ACTN|nr:hypothetical protein [Jiangella asiatica]TDD94389.1 hypothetical protein E1269_31875 [Jiangella asiatica]